MAYHVYKTDLLKRRIRLVRICDELNEATGIMDNCYMLELKRVSFMVTDPNNLVVAFKYPDMHRRTTLA